MWNGLRPVHSFIPPYFLITGRPARANSSTSFYAPRSPSAFRDREAGSGVEAMVPAERDNRQSVSQPALAELGPDALDGLRAKSEPFQPL